MAYTEINRAFSTDGWCCALAAGFTKRKKSKLNFSSESQIHRKNNKKQQKIKSTHIQTFQNKPAVQAPGVEKILIYFPESTNKGNKQ